MCGLQRPVHVRPTETETYKQKKTMNKKMYMQPVLTIDSMEEEMFIAASVSSTSGLDGVEVSNEEFAGGEADARGNHSIWDED